MELDNLIPNPADEDLTEESLDELSNGKGDDEDE